MKHSELADHGGTKGNACGLDSDTGLKCPLPESVGIDELTSDVFNGLENTSCPIAQAIQGRLRFESLLAELSTQFVILPASQVDGHIKRGLQRIVELLDLDRACLAEISTDDEQFVVTHSNQLLGVPTARQLLLDRELPTYARMIRQGQVVRAPDELPPEASQEREYCLDTGLKSHLAIPLAIMGKVVWHSSTPFESNL